MKNFRVPHIYVMVFILLVFMALMTYVLPTGAYERYTDEVSGRTLVAAGSYTVTEASPVSLLGVFQAIPRGMSAAADVIFFVLWWAAPSACSTPPASLSWASTTPCSGCGGRPAG